MKTKRFTNFLSVLALAWSASITVGVQDANALSYNGTIDFATGTLGALLACDPVTFACPDLPVAGNVEFDMSGPTNANFSVPGFFFSNLWVGNCTVFPADGTCMTTDPDAVPGAAFAPILSIDPGTLVLIGGFPTSGAFVLNAFSPTFGFDIAVEFNLDTGKFAATTVAFGVASGTGAFVPVPAAVWLFGSALFGLVGLRRRS